MTVGRRRALALLASSPLAGCVDGGGGWHDIDVSGTSPPLRFALERAPDGRTVTAADYRGRIVLLYFGYTSCPDVCPLTLQNVNVALSRSGLPPGDRGVHQSLPDKSLGKQLQTRTCLAHLLHRLATFAEQWCGNGA